MDLEPDFGAVRSGVQPARELPEHRRVIYVHDMRHLMRGEIIEHERRRENQAPGEIESAGRRARAPAAHRVAQHDAARLDAELFGMPGHRGLEILARLALQEIGDAARHMRPLAGNADQRPALARLEPDPAAFAWPMHDPMIDAAQRHDRARLERDGAGRRASRVPIHAAWRSANSRAALSEERDGIVSTTSRVAVRTLSVKRRDVATRFSATRYVSPSWAMSKCAACSGAWRWKRRNIPPNPQPERLEAIAETRAAGKPHPPLANPSPGPPSRQRFYEEMWL